VYVANTIFCAECGSYLPKGKELCTEPIDAAQVRWGTSACTAQITEPIPLDPDLRSIRLRISARSPDQPEGIKSRMRELEIALIRPIRLGRIDPKEGVYPEVDLTDESAKEYGVSREHACIFRRGNIVEVEDMGSTNGTLLNGTPLAPYNPTLLNDGDQLQLGNLLIEVSFKVHPARRAPLGNSASHSVVL
jgi:hypothetical protein